MQEDSQINPPGLEPPYEAPPPVPPRTPEIIPVEEFSREPRLERESGQPPAPSRPVGDYLRRALLSLAVAILGWAVPGLGHLVLRRWGRAAIGFAAVALLAIAGMRMRGNVFPYHSSDPFDVLGFIADAGSGVFYLLSKTVDAAGPDVSHAAGDYGTRMIAAAGILNVLLLIDASEIAGGQKS